MQHTGLIFSIARRYLPFCDRATDLDDLMQAGAIGIWLAEGTYKPDKGAFSTWATFYIMNEIKAALGFRGSRIRAHSRAVSMNAPLPNSPEFTLEDTLPDPSANIEEQHELEELQAVVREQVNAIENETRRELIKQIYLEDKPVTQAATTLNLPYLYAQREHIKAKKCLKRDKVLRSLAEERGLDRRTKWHYHKTLTSWRYDWESSTETLAFWRLDNQ